MNRLVQPSGGHFYVAILSKTYDSRDRNAVSARYLLDFSAGLLGRIVEDLLFSNPIWLVIAPNTFFKTCISFVRLCETDRSTDLFHLNYQLRIIFISDPQNTRSLSYQNIDSRVPTMCHLEFRIYL